MSAATAHASSAHALRALLAAVTGVLRSELRVVKALNNVSAYALLNGDPLVDSIKTVAASDDVAAARCARVLQLRRPNEC